MKEIDINKEIEATLNSLDGLQKAKAPEGFYERLQARMQNQAKPSGIWINILRYSAAAMIILSLANGYLLFQNDTEEIASANIEDFTAAYFDDNTTLIEY
ncbi:MAG: hypothetical protein ABJN36_14545 [Cyclobacteriaceae bacterium]